jgi:molybdopterin-guanine dinucleotide biosynthesis protein MobB
VNVFGIMGWKNSGKTGLMERVVAEVTARGFSVSTIKHAHHAFDVDTPGKDSFRHRVAGAREVVVSSGARWVLMNELRDTIEPSLDQLLAKLSPVDLVLVEGFKTADIPKIEAIRRETMKTPIALVDAGVVAVACDFDVEVTVPVFDLDDTDAIVDFILDHVGLL